MNKNTIKERMVKTILEVLQVEIENNLEEYITEEDVDEFMWSVDYGQELVRNYIEENSKELIQNYLECIYDEIGTDDLESPF